MSPSNTNYSSNDRLIDMSCRAWMQKSCVLYQHVSEHAELKPERTSNAKQFSGGGKSGSYKKYAVLHPSHSLFSS